MDWKSGKTPQNLAKSAPLNSGRPIAKTPIEQALVEAPLQIIKTKHEKMRENSNRNPNRFRDMLGKNPDCVIEHMWIHSFLGVTFKLTEPATERT